MRCLRGPGRRELLPACRTELREVSERPITTVEGLARHGRLHSVRRAWLEEGAFQCGFCTPGWLVETAALLERRPQPAEAEILAGLERHLCRCCTYPRIRRAVHRALQLAGGPEPPGGESTPHRAGDAAGMSLSRGDPDAGAGRATLPDGAPTATASLGSPTQRAGRGAAQPCPPAGTVAVQPRRCTKRSKRVRAHA